MTRQRMGRGEGKGLYLSHFGKVYCKTLSQEDQKKHEHVGFFPKYFILKILFKYFQQMSPSTACSSFPQSLMFHLSSPQRSFTHHPSPLSFTSILFISFFCLSYALIMARYSTSIRNIFTAIGLICITHLCTDKSCLLHNLFL